MPTRTVRTTTKRTTTKRITTKRTTKRVLRRDRIEENAWDAAKKIPVIRGNLGFSPAYHPEDLERGVKFFVLMLEKLGCETESSCEGHPDGFYITFQGDEETARAIARCGSFAVTLGRKDRQYRISRDGYPKFSDDESRTNYLRIAANSWVKAFGELINVS